MFVDRCMPLCACTSQRSACETWFSLFLLHIVLGFEIRVLGDGSKSLVSDKRNILTLAAIFLLTQGLMLCQRLGDKGFSFVFLDLFAFQLYPCADLIISH